MEIVQQQANQYCGFKIAGEEYAIPVMEVQEVIKPLQVTSVPLAQDEIRGLINLRGQIVTSLSLRKLFGQDEHLSQDYMNIIVKGDDGLYSLVVDEVTDIIDVEEESVERVPDTINPRIKRFVDRIFKRSKGLVILLKIDELIKLEEKRVK
ncbi:MAG: chemotaxis protein CheW [Bdellovibrionota bacterium]|nr:chemotaxis protein CheW [Bdellovibrionota bacterium]